MSPRQFNERTPNADAVDKKVARELAAFRVSLDYEFAQKHLGVVSEEHPRFVDAAQQWMHVAEQEILRDTDLNVHTLSEARYLALTELRAELEEEGEDPVLVDLVDTFIKVTVDEEKLGYEVSDDIAA